MSSHNSWQNCEKVWEHSEHLKVALKDGNDDDQEIFYSLERSSSFIVCVNTLDSAEFDQNNKENYISDSDTSDKTHKSNETEVN